MGYQMTVVIIHCNYNINTFSFSYYFELQIPPDISGNADPFPVYIVKKANSLALCAQVANARLHPVLDACQTSLGEFGQLVF